MVGQFHTVGLPACRPQLLIDENAGSGFIQFHLLCSGIGVSNEGLDVLGICRGSGLKGIQFGLELIPRQFGLGGRIFPQFGLFPSLCDQGFVGVACLCLGGCCLGLMPNQRFPQGGYLLLEGFGFGFAYLRRDEGAGGVTRIAEGAVEPDGQLPRNF